MDLKLAPRFTNRYSSYRFPFNEIQVALHNSKSQGIPFILFLYDENDIFSSQVCMLLVETNLVHDTNILIWDVDHEQNSDLLGLCDAYLDFDLLKMCIKQKETGLFIFQDVDDKLVLVSSLNGIDITKEEIYSAIISVNEEENVTISRMISNQNISNDVPYFDLVKKLNITMANCLEMAIKESIETVKPMLILICKENYLVSETLVSLLTNQDVNSMFSCFSFYGWHVDNDAANVEWATLLEEYPALKIMKSTLLRKTSAAFVLEPFFNKFEVSKIYETCESKEELLFDLHRLNKTFEERRSINFALIQKQSIVNAIENFKDNFGSELENFSYLTIENCIRDLIACETQYWRKTLILFYYNKNDPISNEMALFLLTNQEIKKRFSNLFVVVPWDIEDDTYSSVLKYIVKENFCLDAMSDCIDKKEGALFFIGTHGANDKVDVINATLPGGYNADILTDTILEIGDMFVLNKNITDLVELRACEQFNENSVYSLPKHLSTVKSLHKIIVENCLSSRIRTRKMLLFYLYKASKDANNLVSYLRDSNLVQNFTKQFCFLGWNIDDTNLHSKLALAAKRNFDIHKIELMIEQKKTGLFVFIPIGESLILHKFIKESVSLKNLKSELQECQQVFVTEQLAEEEISSSVETMGPGRFQQMMFDHLGNRDYDCIEMNKNDENGRKIDMEEVFKTKLSFGLFGPPIEAVGVENIKREEKKQAVVDKLYIKLLEKAREFNEDPNHVIYSCIFICNIPLPVVKKKKKDADSAYNPSNDFIPYPVFVLRKCVNSPGKNACRIFVDHDLRVYETWESFLENNKQPEGFLLVPKDGRYEGDQWGNVKLDLKLSPACDMSKTILQVVDIGSAVVGTGAGILGVAAAIPAIPVAPVIGIGAIAVGATVGVYSLIRSGMTLYDRKKHDECMSILNGEARAAYLNMVGGFLGIAGAGANYAFAYFVQNGANLGLVARGTINTINGVNLAVNGTAIVNSAADVIITWYNDGTSPSSLAIIQLTSSILFFGHAVYSFKTANTLINEAQYREMQEIQSSLRSNRHRKTFNKLTKESIRVSGDAQQGRAEVISYMKQLDNTDEILASLTKMNKQLNKEGIRFSISGKEMNFNGQSVNVAEISNMSSMQKSEYLVTLPELDKSPKALKVVEKNIMSEISLVKVGSVLVDLTTIAMKRSFADMCSATISAYSPYIQKALLSYLNKYMNVLANDSSLFKSFRDTFGENKIRFQSLQMIINFFKNQAMPLIEEYAKEHSDAMNNAYKYTKISLEIFEKVIIWSTFSTATIVRQIVDFSLKWVAKKMVDCYDAHVLKRGQSKREIKCNICSGCYYT